MRLALHTRGSALLSANVLAVAAICTLAATGAHAAPRSAPTPWQAAVAARQDFAALPTHTRADFTRVLDHFRAIYHANPADPHAADAIAQVAALLAQQGRELSDARSLDDASAQCDFLARHILTVPPPGPAGRKPR